MRMRQKRTTLDDAGLRRHLTEAAGDYERLARELKQPRFDQGVRLCRTLLELLDTEPMTLSVAAEMWKQVHATPCFHPSLFDIRAWVYAWAETRLILLDPTIPFPRSPEHW